MQIKLFSTDFDGTLHAEHEEPPVPEDLQSLIADLQAAGAAWIINTGRDLSGLLEAVGRARLRVQPDFVVVVERAIYRHDGSTYAPVEPWNGRCDRLHRELFARMAPDLPGLKAWVNARHQAMIYEDPFSPFCVIASSNGEMDAIQNHLEDYCRGVPGLAVMRNDVYARFNHAEFNKGTALAEVARILGVKPDETVAAGDHWNDLAMLSKEVAHGLIAPSNAIEAVKLSVERQGGYVSRQPWGHGVARGLEHLLA
jgi:hydroxymethylpyrimidine pyrophosphatase-like HAD family hydrolase